MTSWHWPTNGPWLHFLSPVSHIVGPTDQMPVAQHHIIVRNLLSFCTFDLIFLYWIALVTEVDNSEDDHILQPVVGGNDKQQGHHC